MSQHIRASRRKYHIIYKTTCIITGRYYIGMHSTDDLEDQYLGSGVRLTRSVKKHGRENHTREIVELCESREAASDREKEIITPELRADPQCLNCGAGGLGAVDRPATSEETRQKLSQHFKTVERTPEWCANISKAHKGKTISAEAIQNRLDTLKERGYKPSEEAKANQRAGQLASEKFKQRYRALIIDEVAYVNMREACTALSLAGGTLTYRLASPNWLSYRWADQPEKDPTKVSGRARGEYAVNRETTTKDEANTTA
jgi:hypothetical protein